MKSAHVPEREILPPPIDIAGLAKRNGVSELQIMRSIRSAERRGEAFSPIVQRYGCAGIGPLGKRYPTRAA
jgi:hypothetical protein